MFLRMRDRRGEYSANGPEFHGEEPPDIVGSLCRVREGDELSGDDSKNITAGRRVKQCGCCPTGNETSLEL